MSPPAENLIHHPTTTVFVDDNEAFLDQVTLLLDVPPYRQFHDADEALAFINTTPANPEALPEFRHSCLDPYEEYTASKIQNRNRFDEISVVVVDFDMPSTNGLVVCDEINNPYIKKVLLTGVANDGDAVQALNAGLIDFYLNKREPNLTKKLQSVIRRLSKRYFLESMPWMQFKEVKQDWAYMYDFDFVDEFSRITEKMRVIEHYPGPGRGEMMLIDESGDALILTVSRRDPAPATGNGKTRVGMAVPSYQTRIRSLGKACSHSYREYMQVGLTEWVQI